MTARDTIRLEVDKWQMDRSTASSTSVPDEYHGGNGDDDTGDEKEVGASEYESEDEFSFMDEESAPIATESSLETESVLSGSDRMSVGTVFAETFARREAQIALCGRCTAFFMMVVALGCLLPITLYVVTSRRQETNFEEAFHSFSDDLLLGFRDHLMQGFAALDGMILDVSLSTVATSWPEISIPDFSLFSSKALYSASCLQSITMVTIVTQDQRQDYEDYVLMNNEEWITQSENFESATDYLNNRKRLLQDGSLHVSGGISYQIYELDNKNFSIASEGPGPYHPIRHLYPLEIESVNYDVASNENFRKEVQRAKSNTASVIGRSLEKDTDGVLLQKVLPWEPAVPGDLFVSMIYPITDSITPTKASGDVTGLLITMASWTDLFSSILPSKVRGVVCVVENTCGQRASFRIDGRKATFLGLHDHHDPKYSQYRNTYSLADLSTGTHTLSQVPLEEACPYQFHVYPSATTKEGLSSVDPILLVAIAIGFFSLIVIVFVVYDRFMERRNRAVLVSAVEARAIVSSLFPANVRDRLFESSRQEQKRKKKLLKIQKKLNRTLKKLRAREKASKTPTSDTPCSSVEIAKPRSLKDMQTAYDSVHPALEAALQGKETKWIRHPKHELKDLLAAATVGLSEGDDFGLAKPIADIFPHTSVIFADIVGFTAWSSEREPQDVFLLLQTIYHAIDRLAKRRGVFKVETIGDCYVAVTGLPDPQPDHAVRLARFAKECILKMSEVTKKLELRLGPDTSELSMRIGLHSGPVTAGVLQGEKSRFQLFGDTMNTASRMESTGDKDRIHLSKATADLLVAAGKSYWIKPRQDRVHAKGKGLVQTYWLVSRENFDPSQSPDMSQSSSVLRPGAPARSRSSMAVVEPTRGVQRTTSDSIHKVVPDNTPQSQKLRQERLIQWQVELFAGLLIKIVAARSRKLRKKDSKRSGSWVGVAKSSSHSIYSTSLHSLSDIEDEDDDDARLNSSKATLGKKKPNSDSLVIMPSRRASIETSGSLDCSVDTFGSFGSGGNVDANVASESIDTKSVSSFDLDRSQVYGTKALSSLDDESSESHPDVIVVDEVAEIITLPKFNPKTIKAFQNVDSIKLDDDVLSQLADFIGTVAGMYRSNPFHCFEHACHVTMATNKFLNRIVIPENVNYERASKDIASDLHTYTYGITSDPLTHFAIAFSALVHDVDHTGVPNSQLAKENPDMADMYRNTSLAEQNSVDLAWNLFMDPRYSKLQDCIALDKEERSRFRQLLVNCVMATDIFEPTMKALRNNRWDKAFREDQDAARNITESSIEEDRNTKATIVIEHIIQASDVAHTMQHWHIYQKWNERLFNEMYLAFETGRAATNPADGWYKGELWFFDHYVIPLAKKLEECNVFGVSSAECLDYATANRNEWSVKGEEVVAAMMDRYRKRKMVPVKRQRSLAPRKVVRSNSLKGLTIEEEPGSQIIPSLVRHSTGY